MWDSEPEAIDATYVSNDPAITTLFGPRHSARVTSEPSAGTALRNFGRFLGRALVFFSLPLFLLSGYAAIARYWIRTGWMKSEATVLNGEFRELSSGSTNKRGSGTFSKSYFYHCTVSYPVAGETWRSQLDSPPSPYQLDAQAWAGSWSQGHIAIRYLPSNPSKIRLADNPSEVTAMGALRVAFYVFVSGMLLMLISKTTRLDSR